MFNKRFSDLYTEVGQNIRDTTTTSQTIIKRYINEAYGEFLKRFNFDIFDYDYTINTVAGTKDYTLPSNFSKEKYVLDTTNSIYLNRTDLQEYTHDKPSLTSTQGNVNDYVIINSPVNSQPTSASTLSFSSSSSSDTAVQVFVRGLDSNDVEVSENVTLTGTSPVVTSNSYNSIITVSKDVTVGTVTATSNSGAVTVAVMGPDEKEYKRKVLRLFQTPTQTLVLSILYIIKPMPLTNDDDSLVYDCSDFVIARATAKTWRYKRQFAKAAEFDVEAERYLIENIWNQENQPNQEHRMFITPYSRETV